MQPLTLTVDALEAGLYEAFPREDAESWDNPGLSVGDRNSLITGVALNLDQTPEAILAAHEAGCNVLVTHHPPFIKGGPSELGPASQATLTTPGRVLYEAARLGVSVIAMHTCADRAVATRQRYAELLDWELLGNFEHLINPARTAQDSGYGALFAAPQGATLGNVAATAKDAFGGAPRIWGPRELPVSRIALLNGSWSEPEVYDACIAAGIECVIVGETRYHFCTDAMPHLAIIDLGHDISELPIIDVLQDAIVCLGVPTENIVNLGLSANNWWSI